MDKNNSPASFMLTTCPFCGNDVDFAFDVDGMPNGVWCRNCHMIARWSRIKEKRGDTAGKLMDQYAKAWNRRA
jgi:hypothetical protein